MELKKLLINSLELKVSTDLLLKNIAANSVMLVLGIFCFTKPKFSFSKDTCQNIVALWDADYSGRLDDEEFENLMQDVASLRVRDFIFINMMLLAR